MFENSSRWLRRKMTWSKHNEQTKPIEGKGGAPLWNTKAKTVRNLLSFFLPGIRQCGQISYMCWSQGETLQEVLGFWLSGKEKKRKKREEWKEKDILQNSHHLCSIEAGMSCPQMETFKNSAFHGASCEGALGLNRCTISWGYMAGR